MDTNLLPWRLFFSCDESHHYKGESAVNWSYKFEQKYPTNGHQVAASFELSTDGLNVLQSNGGVLLDPAFTSTSESLLKLRSQYGYFFTLDAAAVTRITCSEEIVPFLTLLLQQDPKTIPVDERYLSDEEMELYDYASDVLGAERGCLLEVNGQPWTNWDGGSLVPAVEPSELCVTPWAKVSFENSGGGMTSGSVSSTIGEYFPGIGIVIDDDGEGNYRVNTFEAENPSNDVFDWATQGEFVKDWGKDWGTTGSGLASRTPANAIAALITEKRPTGVFPGLVAFRHATESDVSEVLDIDIELDEDYFGLDFSNMWTISLGLDDAQQIRLIQIIQTALPNAPEYVVVTADVDLP